MPTPVYKPSTVQGRHGCQTGSDGLAPATNGRPAIVAQMTDADQAAVHCSSLTCRSLLLEHGLTVSQTHKPKFQ